ncbi:hypothetical protein AKL17_3932 [Frigidibacter mobilis]|uniref:Uncharacterized protein n=1 Tax=Frigidibacter mobilis TaxID=1335048 RepID=A0A159Z935_9RHOB|nr:hypothetical protein AKL17_3932 [Frigidibacter mobilis]
MTSYGETRGRISYSAAPETTTSMVVQDEIR